MAVKWAPAVVAAGILVAAFVWLWPTPPDNMVDVQQRQAIEVADTIRRVAQQTMVVARRRTDRVLRDTTTSRAEIQQVVGEEREATDSTLKVADRQIEARDTRIKTLEKRAGGRLFLFSEVGVASAIAPPFTLEFVGEAGIALHLDRNTQMQLSVTTDERLKLSVRRQLRIL